MASGCAIDFLAPAREGDVLTAVGHERSASGRTGVYDIEVTNQRGDIVLVCEHLLLVERRQPSAV